MNGTPNLTRVDYEKRIFSAMNYISRNIERELSLQEIAETAAFSPFHFHRIFKAVTGENVAEFTRRLRVELAANRLLAYPARDITSIALSCGFSSSQNFAKAFRQLHTMTPTQYRKIKDRQERLPLQYPESGMAALDNQKPKTSVDVSIREMPISKAATMRRIGMNAETCAAAFIELLSWAKGRVAPGPGKLIASYWDNPEVTPIDKCRFDCCLLVPEDIPLDDHVFYQEIGGGIWAFCRFEIGPDEIQTAWEEAFRWLVQSGYECRPLPCCEIYYNDAREHPEGKWIIDIAIPLFNN